jgi:hypothetical protein
VVDRVELADLYQIKSLYSACGLLIRCNLKMVKKDEKWLELKKKAPELAFSIIEDVDECGNGNDVHVQRIPLPLPQKNSLQKCTNCGDYGHVAWDCVTW